MSNRRKNWNPTNLSSGWRRFRRWMAETSRPLGQAILGPVKLLFLPLKALILFLDVGLSFHHETTRKKSRQRQWWVGILRWPIRLLFLPSLLFQRAIRKGRQQELLFLIPGALVGALFAFVLFQITVRGQALQQRYLAGARRAVSDGNLLLAKTYYRRILEKENLSDAEALQWAIILGRTGEEERADDLLEQLAPDNRKGYAPAHRIKAIQLANEFDRNGEARNLEVLRWHLENAGVGNTETDVAWAGYYQAKQQPAKAIEYLSRAAGEFPELYLSIAKIGKEHGFTEQQEWALSQAVSRFGALVERDPLDDQSRVSLVSAKVELAKMAEAESILRKGLQLQQSPLLRRASSDFYVLLYDQSTAAAVPLPQRMTCLKQAINADDDYALPYRRLAGITLRTMSENESSLIKQQLQAMVTTSDTEALDHCNLAHILWTQNDLEAARWHLNQAWRLDQELGQRVNRLALAFVNSDPPDLAWAFELAEQRR